MSFEIDSLTEVNYDNTELSSEDNDVFQKITPSGALQ